MDGKSNLQQRLAILLREAERAHSDYDKSLRHRDDDCPTVCGLYCRRPGRPKLTSGADGEARTPNQWFTKPLLYH